MFGMQRCTQIISWWIRDLGTIVGGRRNIGTSGKLSSWQRPAQNESRVVNWNTVRLLLILAAQLELATRQVDCAAAFVHAPIDKPPNWNEMSDDEKDHAGVCVEMARGLQEPGEVHKLKKSLHGLKQAPRNFFHHLIENLKKVGFEQQIEVDPCLFISP